MKTPNFNQRLVETISWCLSQELSGHPAEDENVTCRRLLNLQGAELIHQAYIMERRYEHAGWLSGWLARKKLRQASEIRNEGQRLRATADVGSIVPPLRHQLRSEALRPFAQSLAQLGADHAAIMDQVAEARSQALKQSSKGSNSQSGDPCGGRFLLYAPEENLSDGAAEYASFGFFDVDNIPPWDTWVTMFGKHLVSWVPPQLFRLVQQGLDVNPEQCIVWADDPSVSKEPIMGALGESFTKAV
jgi:hypothetical protein